MKRGLAVRFSCAGGFSKSCQQLYGPSVTLSDSEAVTADVIVVGDGFYVSEDAAPGRRETGPKLFPLLQLNRDLIRPTRVDGPVFGV